MPELCNLLLKYIRKQVEAIEDLSQNRTSFQNGAKQKWRTSSGKKSEAKDVIYQIKLGKAYLQKKKLQLIELKQKVTKKGS